MRVLMVKQQQTPRAQSPRGDSQLHPRRPGRGRGWAPPRRTYRRVTSALTKESESSSRLTGWEACPGSSWPAPGARRDPPHPSFPTRRSCGDCSTNASVIDLMRTASVVVLPSVEPDCCPTVVLEAMAVGRSVVTAASGGIVELVDHRVTACTSRPATRMRSRRRCWRSSPIQRGRRQSVERRSSEPACSRRPRWPDGSSCSMRGWFPVQRQQSEPPTSRHRDRLRHRPGRDPRPSEQEVSGTTPRTSQ